MQDCLLDANFIRRAPTSIGHRSYASKIQTNRWQACGARFSRKSYTWDVFLNQFMNPDGANAMGGTPRDSAAESPELRARALLQAGNFDELRWMCLEEDLPEPFLLELCEYPELHCPLAHRKGPRSVLNRMAEESEFSEAAQTLGQLHYREAIESTASLTQFLVRHRGCRDLFERLIRDSDLDDPRLVVVLECMRGAEFEAELMALLAELRRIRQAEIGINPDQIEQLAAMREPRVLLEIARNPCTPEPLLRKLSQVEQMKFCRQIRVAAQAQLNAKARSKS
jgi:hypothetical protein